MEDDNNTMRIISPYAVISELFSTIYNLSVLAKAEAKRDEHQQQSSSLTASEQLKKWLTILEYCETCLELATLSLPGIRTTRYGGNPLKWAVVGIVQLTKCAGRMVLLLKYKEGLLPHPPLQIRRQYLDNSTISQLNTTSNTYTLKSGRKIRSVRQGYQQSKYDSINDVIRKETIVNLSDDIYKVINNLEILAEGIYIIKPLAHLGALYMTDRKSWKPWLLSFGLDIISYLILYEALLKNKITDVQKRQLLQRRFGLILYLLRSPFYDKNTKHVLQIALYTLEMYVPCTSRFLVRPLLNNLPLIQQIYFYIWSH